MRRARGLPQGGKARRITDARFCFSQIPTLLNCVYRASPTCARTCACSPCSLTARGTPDLPEMRLREAPGACEAPDGGIPCDRVRRRALRRHAPVCETGCASRSITAGVALAPFRPIKTAARVAVFDPPQRPSDAGLASPVTGAGCAQYKAAPSEGDNDLFVVSESLPIIFAGARSCPNRRSVLAKTGPTLGSSPRAGFSRSCF